jgi:hypothetical protein
MGNYIPHIKIDKNSSTLSAAVRNLFCGNKQERLLCSDCFQNQGLRLDAEKIGFEDSSACKNCSSAAGRKLNRSSIATLAQRFFVLGTFQRCDFGAAPIVQFNDKRATDINLSPWFEADLRLIERALKVGFFYYGPRLWMVGEVEPLKDLENPDTRKAILERIVKEYPTVTLRAGSFFYRLRVAPTAPENSGEYDSPPMPSKEPGRLDSANLRIMYASQDLQVCIHECRVTADDELFVATLAPKKDLRLLDLTELLKEEEVTEFESLDMAIHMLFLAGKHAYGTAREIALAAQRAGFDGLMYPSYFSLLRTGGMPFETLLGISHRRIPRFADREKSKIVPNLAIFGRPINDGKVKVKSINRLILARVDYELRFGPVGYKWVDPADHGSERVS